MRKDHNIEDLFRKEFEGYRVTPSLSLWGRVLRKMRWKEFLRFSPSRFNIYYMAAILGVSTALYLGINNSSGKISGKFTPNISDTTINQADKYKINPPVDSLQGRNLPAKAGNISQAEKKIKITERKEKSVNTDKNIPGTKPSAENPPEGSQHREQTAPHAVAAGTRKPKTSPSIPKEKIKSPTVTRKESVSYVRFRVEPASGCPPLQVHFINRSENCTGYTWSIGNKKVELSEDNPVYVFNNPGIYVISLTGMDNKGKKTVRTDTVKVFEPPKARFEIFPEDATVPETEITFINSSENAAVYFWDFGDGHFSQEQEPSHRYTTEGPFRIVLKVWSSRGCTDSMVVRNAFENSMYYIRFPNAFLANPNGPTDGYYTEGPGANDVFHPVWKGVSEYHLQIYNRRGELIFESHDLQRGWDGYIHDEMAKPDVYIWKARGVFANGKPFVRFGNVTLIKRKN